MTHRLMMVNISAKGFRNPLRNNEVTAETRKNTKDGRTDEWTHGWTWVLSATHHLMTVNISAKGF